MRIFIGDAAKHTCLAAWLLVSCVSIRQAASYYVVLPPRNQMLRELLTCQMDHLDSFFGMTAGDCKGATSDLVSRILRAKRATRNIVAELCTQQCFNNSVRLMM